MANVKENTVSRHGQVSNSDRTYYLGDPSSNTRILIYGNSITLHPFKEELGWFNNWGMAASRKNNDYVHILYQMLCKNLGYKPYLLISQICDVESQLESFDYSLLNKESEFKPNIIILRIGDNVFPIDSEDVLFKTYDQLIHCGYCKDTNKIIITGSYFVNKPIEPIIEKYCNNKKIPFVKLDDISMDESNWGGLDKFKHTGVAMHPGDKGMKIIAHRLIKEIIK